MELLTGRKRQNHEISLSVPVTNIKPGTHPNFELAEVINVTSLN